MSNSQSLSFPYNIYVHCLQLENLPLDYIHPGIRSFSEVINENQQVTPSKLTQQILSCVSTPFSTPADILLIDVPASLANNFAAQGHPITLIYQDIVQFQLAKMQLHASIAVQQRKITELATTSSHTHLIYWQDAHPFDGLTLFNAAHNLLNLDGKLSIIGRFSLQRTAQQELDDFALLEHIQAQARRCGFTETQHTDYSENMLPFLNFWLNLLQKHHQTLSSTLRLPHNQLSNLIYQLQRLHYQYDILSQSFSMLEFTKTHVPRWKMTPMTPEQQPAICDLFNKVFAKPMSPAFWNWKYGQGRGLGITAWSEDQLIAHYGGSLREILYFGQPKTAVQITDVMVLSKERGVLTRKGAFFLTTASFLEYYIGYGVKTWIGFGFPSRRHVQLAQNLHLYAPVGEVVELRYPSLENLPTLSQPSELIAWREKFSFRGFARRWRMKAWNKTKLIHNLWIEMANCLNQSLVGVRDWQRVHYRYLSHPHNQYELFFVAQDQRIVALVVLHFEGELCKLMDFIGHLDYVPLAVQHVRHLAQQRGISQVSLWITEQFVSTFPARDRTQLSLEIAVPHNIWTQTFPPADVAERWWLMAGDTDYL